MYEEVVEKGRGPKVLKSNSPKVPGSKGPWVLWSRGPKDSWSKSPKDQDISKSYSNTSLTLKNVHLVSHIDLLLTNGQIDIGTC